MWERMPNQIGWVATSKMQSFDDINIALCSSPPKSPAFHLPTPLAIKQNIKQTTKKKDFAKWNIQVVPLTIIAIQLAQSP